MKSITEKRKWEEKSNEQYAFMDALPQLIWIVQPDGWVAYTNQRWRNYSGEQQLPSRANLLLQQEIWPENLHPEDRAYVLALQQQAFATSEPRTVRYRLREGHTGTYRWFLAQVVPYYNEAGKIARWMVSCTDIDDQKQTEDTLRQSQERVDLLMRSSLIGIFVAEDNEIVDANATFLRMTGYSQKDLDRRNIQWTTTTPALASFSEQVHQEVVVQRYKTPFETELVCKDGSKLPVLVDGIAVHDQVLHGMGLVMDNAARHELQQRKDSFVSIVSHELKTPITSLKLQNQVLRKKLKKQGLSDLEIASDRMDVQLNAITRMVDELLDVSRIQAGKLEYARDLVDLDMVLREVISLFQRMQTTHTIALHRTPAPIFIIGDRDRIECIFLNILSNAIKYSPSAPLIDVLLTTSGESVTVSIRDQGIGIPQELQEKIFDRFYRAAPLQQHAFPGLGLGLYIVAKIIKHHGGTIRVESELGKGATFHITFPLSAPEHLPVGERN
ncbi:sensor histidine kinase [Dictyobacter aurantiacus]|uniref:histidine kinase n=1 Tax=Dictyobacter aurantiacus TaxID=1936993 RepID=A0A401Z993_9CHLR|nr:PAS domain-containing sensor histidine kinase [Dictyobacter aurantiacus]GCE03437.1 hypothetical protein KDAU_07660 [Dictyobacter aurantiacus]